MTDKPPEKPAGQASQSSEAANARTQGYGYGGYAPYRYGGLQYGAGYGYGASGMPRGVLGMRNIGLVLAIASRRFLSLRWRISLVLIVALAAVQSAPGFDSITYETHSVVVLDTASNPTKTDQVRGLIALAPTDLMSSQVRTWGKDIMVSSDLKSTYILGKTLEELDLSLEFSPQRSGFAYATLSRISPPPNGLALPPPIAGTEHYSWGHAEGHGVRFVPSQEALAFDTPVEMLCNYLGAGLFRVRPVVNGQTLPPMVARVGEALVANQGTLYIDEFTAWPGSEFRFRYLSQAALNKRWEKSLRVRTLSRLATGAGVPLQLRIVDEDPDISRKILKRIVENYNSWQLKSLQGRLERTAHFYLEELANLDRRIEAIGKRYGEFLASNPAVLVKGTDASLAARLASTEEQIYDLNHRLRVRSHRISDLHPDILHTRQQITELERRRQDLEAEIDSRPARHQQEIRHQLNLTISENHYKRLHQQLQYTRLSMAGISAPLRVLNEPASTVETSSLATKLSYIISTTFVVLAGGALYSLLSTLFSGRILSFTEMEESGAPVVSTMPHLPVPQDTRDLCDFLHDMMANSDEPYAAYAHEASRTIYARMERARGSMPSPPAGNGPAGMVVVHSGSGPGVGKSLITMLMAGYLSKAGKKILVLDGDLRKRRVEAILSKHPRSRWSTDSSSDRGDADTGSLGLVEVLRGNISLLEATRTNDLLGVDFVPAGDVNDSATWLFTPSNLQGVLDEARERYDIIYLDTPPLLAVIEAEAILAVADMSFMIVRHLVTTAIELRTLLAKYGQLNLQADGAIFSDISVSQIDDIYDYSSYQYQFYGRAGYHGERPQAAYRNS